jgi:large subunit ribosomal protein L32
LKNKIYKLPGDTMPVPKRKRSRARRDKRFANKGIKPKAVATCQTCQAPLTTHAVCQECGYYKGKKILRTKTDRMYQRGQAREARAAKVQAAQPAVQQEAATGEKK